MIWSLRRRTAAGKKKTTTPEHLHVFGRFSRNPVVRKREARRYRPYYPFGHAFQCTPARIRGAPCASSLLGLANNPS